VHGGADRQSVTARTPKNRSVARMPVGPPNDLLQEGAGLVRKAMNDQHSNKRRPRGERRPCLHQDHSLGTAKEEPRKDA
jgi:hypothetical protein